MSFILDALRKSEHERQRSIVPGLSQVPLATPRRELPPWAVAVMGVLLVTVLGLAGAWWQSMRARVDQPQAAAPVVTEQRSVAIPAPPPATPRAATTAVPAPNPAPVAPTPARSLSTAAGDVDAIAGTRIADTTSPIAAPAPPPNAPTLPSAAALRAEGISLPELHLELHAFSARPSERFVFINGRKYVEGERLADGPELVSIAPNGVVLTQQGRRFLLAPE